MSKASFFITISMMFAPMFLFAGTAGAQEEKVEKPEGTPADWVPLPIELPEPDYGATPCPYWGPNLEPEDFRDRPPFFAPPGTQNVALKKAVTSSAAPARGKLEQVTDEKREAAKINVIELPEGTQWVQIDLGQEYELHALLVWHSFEKKDVYFDLVALVSNDPEFKTGVTTLYNNDYDNTAGYGVGTDKEYIENNQGRLMPAKGTRARYVRLYSNGNSGDDLNRYIEVEVYGK